ncbi:hypothetical protein F66182_5320 [Fusarium sp. NRRL 66182]|nr:hypothetical protein F66182_5320 [Fusarium sp. NRRL 66182]
MSLSAMTLRGCISALSVQATSGTSRATPCWALASGRRQSVCSSAGFQTCAAQPCLDENKCENELGWTEAFDDRMKSSPIVCVAEMPAFPAQAPRQQITSLSPQKNTLFLAYTVSKLSPATPRSNAAGIVPEYLAGHKSALHELCVEVLATTYFGRTRRDSEAYVQGLGLYSRALTQLRIDISNANTELGTIMSVLCLCVYENIVFSQPTAWLMHYEGLGRLLQSRGPKAWKSPKEKQILRLARYFVILSAGHQRRQCFLEQAQWESTRCMPQGETPDKIDLLHDILAHSPGIVHEYDNVRRRGCRNSSAAKALRQRVQSLIDRVHDWLESMPWACLPNLGEINTPLPDDPMDCVALAICYAMLICLYQPCQYLSVPLTPDDCADIVSNTNFLSMEICRLSNWALGSQESANFALLLVYPLQIAWFCLKDAPMSQIEQCNIQSIMDGVVADCHGFELGRVRCWGALSLDNGQSGFLF